MNPGRRRNPAVPAASRRVPSQAVAFLRSSERPRAPDMQPLYAIRVPTAVSVVATGGPSEDDDRTRS